MLPGHSQQREHEAQTEISSPRQPPDSFQENEDSAQHAQHGFEPSLTPDQLQHAASAGLQEGQGTAAGQQPSQHAQHGSETTGNSSQRAHDSSVGLHKGHTSAGEQVAQSGGSLSAPSGDQQQQDNEAQQGTEHYAAAQSKDAVGATVQGTAATGAESQEPLAGIDWGEEQEAEKEALAAGQQLARENSLALQEVKQAMQEGKPLSSHCWGFGKACAFQLLV